MTNVVIVGVFEAASDYVGNVIVFVDANMILADPELRSGVWGQLKTAVAAGHVQVVAPEIAIDEAIVRRSQTLRSIGRKLREAAKSAPEELRDLAVHAQTRARELADGYGTLLNATWEAHGFRVVQTVEAGHVEVARRAARRIRPFNDQGNGYRDTMHWLTLLEVARQSPNVRVTLLSNDGIFATRDDKLLNALEIEFQESNQAGIVLCRRLTKLEVPGHYTSEPVEARQYEVSLENMLLLALVDENVLRQIRTSGVFVPYSDWDEILMVTDLELPKITTRAVGNQSHPDLQFEATAMLLVRGNYIHEENGLDEPQLTTKDVEMPVRIAGLATAITSTEVSDLRDLEVVNTGDDLMLIDTIRGAGKRGLAPNIRAELVEMYGETAVSRVEAASPLPKP